MHHVQACPRWQLKHYQAASPGSAGQIPAGCTASAAPRRPFEAQTGYGYNAEPFGETPCVCLRIPTGGGKTLLAAHAIGRHGARMARPAPQAAGAVAGAERHHPQPDAVGADHTWPPVSRVAGAGGGDDVRCVCDLDELWLCCRRRTMRSARWWWWPPSRAFAWKTPTSATSMPSAKSFEAALQGPPKRLRGKLQRACPMPWSRPKMWLRPAAKAGREMLATLRGPAALEPGQLAGTAHGPT
jgi:hypothetical protein